MLKKFLRAAAVLLCLTLLCSLPAYAAQTRISDQISDATAALTATDSGYLSLRFTIYATDTMDVLGASRVKIQRYNGSNWETEYTYTVSNTPTLQTANRSRYTKTLTYAPQYAGEQYRAIVSFYAKSSQGSSSATYITNTVTP